MKVIKVYQDGLMLEEKLKILVQEIKKTIIFYKTENVTNNSYLVLRRA